MRLILTNFRSVQRREIDLVPGINFLAGPNGNGKSTLAIAAGVLAAGVRAPITGKVGRDANKLARDYRGIGTAAIEGEGWSIRGQWEAGKDGKDGSSSITTTGRPPGAISPLAAGIHRLSDMNDEERATAIAKVLGVEITEEQVEQAAKDAGATGLWTSKSDPPWITAFKEYVGGDRTAESRAAAHKLCEGEAKAAQGAWRQITGKTWAKNSAEWVHSDAEGETLTNDRYKELQAEAEQLEEQIGGAATTAAVSEAELKRLRDLAGQGAGMKGQVSAAEGAVSTAEHEVDQATAALQALPTPGVAPIPCPHCGKGLVLIGNKIEAAQDKLTPKEQAKQAQERAAALRTVDEGKARVVAARDKLAELQRLKRDSDEAVKRIGEIEKQKTAEGPVVDVAALRQQLAKLKAKIEGFKATSQARSQAKLVACWVAAREMFAPDGLVVTALRSKVEGVNRLAEGWHQKLGFTVTLDADLNLVGSGGRKYDEACGYEKYLFDQLVRLACATIERPWLYVIDQVEQLQPSKQNAFLGLVRSVLDKDTVVIVTKATEKQEGLPDLQKAKAGQTLWILKEEPAVDLEAA